LTMGSFAGALHALSWASTGDATDRSTAAMRAPPTLAPARAAVSVKTEVRICLLSRRIRGTHQMRCAARRTHAKLRACDHGAMEDSLRRHAVQSILREQEWGPEGTIRRACHFLEEASRRRRQWQDPPSSPEDRAPAPGFRVTRSCSRIPSAPIIRQWLRRSPSRRWDPGRPTAPLRVPELWSVAGTRTHERH